MYLHNVTTLLPQYRVYLKTSKKYSGYIIDFSGYIIDLFIIDWLIKILMYSEIIKEGYKTKQY